MIRQRRSALYVPASNPRAIDKARTLPCDVVILDLEDAVAPDAKLQAREQAVAAVRAGGFGAREVVVRVNALDSPWGAADLEAVVRAAPQAILVPKVGRREDLVPYEQRLAERDAIALWAMIETAASIFHVEQIAAAAAGGRLAALVVGTNDLAKEACFRPGTDRQPLLGALGLVVLAARAHGLAVLDGVFNAIDDHAGLAAQCAQGSAFGFDGKTLIHPGQIDPCNLAFTPDSAAVEAARRIVAAFDAPQHANQGALRVDGQMVERLHLAQARRTLAMAGTDDEAAVQEAPYGSWASPLTAARATAGALRLGQITVDGDDVYWLEGRASEGGRNVLVRAAAGGAPVDVSPANFNVRSRVHEYGGAAYAVHQGTIYASNFADQQLHAFRAGSVPRALTPAGYFYAQCRVDAARRRLLCVREDHTRGDAQPPAAIVAVPLGATALSAGAVLASGADFFSDPALSPDGQRLAWLQWNHPNMPWDGTELYVAELDALGMPAAPVRVAGGSDESVFQPTWSPDGLLHFISDRTGWWNLYRWREGVVEPVHAMAADFGKPQWSLGTSTYAFVSATRIVVTYADRGRWRLALLLVDSSTLEPLAVALEPLDSVVATPRAVFFVGGSAVEGSAITRVTLGSAQTQVLQRSRADRLDPAFVSAPEAITFDSAGLPVHAFYYPPANSGFSAPAGTLPPLLVLSHGGPTGATTAVFDPAVQFWTTRGFAVLDVNYGGSTGYGRAYRRRLDGQWGIVDVRDAVNAARHLVAAGKADPARLIARGGSAGGYTTLAALAFHDTFTAGASYYGVSDLEALARDTHKFESRYLDRLVGPYPEAQSTYRERSPIHAVDRLDCALILLQGLEDKVVPPNQSEMMAAAVRGKGLPVAYVGFEGEQHGFRKAENLIRALESELYFYGKVFGFTPADALAPVPIENLKSGEVQGLDRLSGCDRAKAEPVKS